MFFIQLRIFSGSSMRAALVAAKDSVLLRYPSSQRFNHLHLPAGSLRAAAYKKQKKVSAEQILFPCLSWYIHLNPSGFYKRPRNCRHEYMGFIFTFY